MLMYTIFEFLIIFSIVLTYWLLVKKNYTFLGVLCGLVGMITTCYRFYLISEYTASEIESMWMNKYFSWLNHVDKGYCYTENAILLMILLLLTVGSVLTFIKNKNTSDKN